MKLVLGVGCDRGVSLETLSTAVDRALAEIGATRRAVVAVASIDKKSDETALLQLADQQGWPLHFYPALDLAEVDVPSPSAVVLKYMGTPSVAEAAALLAADTTMKDLLVEKYKFLGTDGKNATVSVVRGQ